MTYQNKPFELGQPVAANDNIPFNPPATILHFPTGLKLVPGTGPLQLDLVEQTYFSELETTDHPDCPSCGNPMKKHKKPRRVIQSMPVGQYPHELRVIWHQFRCICPVSTGGQYE